MEDKIEVGEYVRIKNGYIRKVIKEFDKNNNCYIVDEPYYNEKISEITKGVVLEEDIVKISKDIRDLIKIGDILEISLSKIHDSTKLLQIKDEEQLEIIKEMNIEYIKSIICKEQFESIKYEV